MNESTKRRWLDQTRAAWDERAEMFDARSAANAQAEDRQVELDFIERALRLPPGARVLDAGCGTGHFAIAFAERGYTIDGIDISPAMIERARANAKDAGVEISFVVGDLLPLDAPDGAYDAVFARMSLQFSPHLSAVLDEFGRVTAVNGKFWLAVPGSLSPIYRHSWERFLSDEPEPMNYVTPWELVQLLEKKGWTVEEQWGSFDPIGDDATNPAQEIDTAALPLLLQQAAATVWNIIARR
ncbi:MAG: class I SAM-dependent methyltransferase [Thermomicrobiales bacterium]